MLLLPAAAAAAACCCCLSGLLSKNPKLGKKNVPRLGFLKIHNSVYRYSVRS
jgi:hypothetical protein